MNNETETKLIELVATDRLYTIVSSLDGKLKRRREKTAKAVSNLEGIKDFDGERAFAYVESGETSKARGLRDAVAEFSEAFPKYGSILQGMIAEKRAVRETNLYFGMQDGTHLSSGDYLEIMGSLGFSEHAARRVYPDLMEASRKLSRERDYATRSILVG